MNGEGRISLRAYTTRARRERLNRKKEGKKVFWESPNKIPSFLPWFLFNLSALRNERM
jgi:hypothetical protein